MTAIGRLEIRAGTTAEDDMCRWQRQSRQVMKLILTCVLLTANWLPGAEIDLPLSKWPEKVQAAARHLAEGGKITHTSRETEKDRRVIYEVAYRIGHKRFEAEISGEGKVLVVDEEVTLAQVPEVVAKTIKEKTAGGKIAKIEKATTDKGVFYETEFRRDGKEHEVKVSPNGKIIAVE